MSMSNETQKFLTTDELTKRREQKKRTDRRKAVLGTGATALALAVAAVSYAPANRMLDRAAGLHEAEAALLQNGKPEASPHIKNVTFQFEGVGANSLSFAVAKYAPEQDLTEAIDRLKGYLPQNQGVEDPKSTTVYPNQELTFAINEETHEILPKDQAPPTEEPSVEGAG